MIRRGFICIPVLSLGMTLVMACVDPIQAFNETFELKVLSYNIWGWTSPFETRLELIARGIAELNPHVVGLQEVMESPDSDGADNSAVLLANRLEELTGERWYVYKENSWNFGDSVFGFGILSRYPIFRMGYRFIPRGEFDRILQWAQIESPVGFISFYNTHLSYGDQWETRIEQAEKIRGYIQADDTTKLHMSTIMTGDFNDVPGSVPITIFTEVGQDSFWFYDTWDVSRPGEPGYTVPSWAPSMRIDYVFLKANENGTVRNSQVVFEPPDSNGVNPSDHLGVLSIIAYDIHVFDVHIISPKEGETVSGIAPISWNLSENPEEVTLTLWVSDNAGSTWELLLWNETMVGNTFLWNTESHSDGTKYRLKIYAQGKTSVGMVESPGTFTVNNPGNAFPEIEVLSPEAGTTVSGVWSIHLTAEDADGDPLTCSMEYTWDNGVHWETLFSNLLDPEEFEWNTFLFANSQNYRLDFHCTDGHTDVSDTTGVFEVYNERHDVILSHRFYHAQGYSNASLWTNVIDPDQMTGALYRITINDSIPTEKSYDVMRTDTGEKVVMGATDLDGVTEGPLFDGLRLLINDVEKTEIDHEHSGWEIGSSNLEATIYLPSITIGSDMLEGYPYPADYIISIYDHIVDTSASAFGAPEVPMMFDVRNRTEDRKIDVAFLDIDSDYSISRFDEIFFLEPSDTSEFLLTWSIFFGGQTGAVSPQPGDEFVLRTLKPLSGDDVYEFIATLTPVELASIEVSPSSVDLMLGERQQFLANGYGVDGLVIFPPITSVWSTDGGTITVAGLYAATIPGDFMVTASVTGSSITGHATVHVVSCSVLGDANNDGVVDVTDVMSTVNFILGLDPDSFDIYCADYNRDERIDILDVVGIIQAILGL